MSCEELIAYLSDYIDRNLSAELLGEAQAHLATCQNCQVVLDSTQKVIFLYHATRQRAIPAHRRQAIFSRLKQAME